MTSRTCIAWIAISLLSGCASLTKPSVVLEPETELMEPCERPSLLQGPSQKEYDRLTIENALRAHDCANKTESLQEWIRGIKR